MKKSYNNPRTNGKKKKFKYAPKNYNSLKTRLKKKRLCLKCGDKFISKGPYNRICEKCGIANERIALGIYAVRGIFPDKPELLEDLFLGLN